MSTISFKVNGASLSLFAGALKKLEQEVLARGESIIEEQTEEVFELSKVLCPVDTGALLESAKKASETEKGKITGAIGYGGDNLHVAYAGPNVGETKPTRVYAWQRHEDPFNTVGSKNNPNASGKWLETALYQRSSDFEKAAEEGFLDLFGGV